MRRKVISTVDRYIFIQFLATYFFSIVLILAVAIAFDVTEKLDKLLQPDVPLKAILWDYYANFVPYYALRSLLVESHHSEPYDSSAYD